MKLFFILYDGRSGSTYISKLIAESSAVLIPHESNFIHTIANHFGTKSIQKEELEDLFTKILEEEKFRDWELSKRDLLNLFANTQYPIDAAFLITEILDYYQKQEGGFLAVGIKKGAYLKIYDYLWSMFPEAKFIFITRDGRAVYGSKKKGHLLRHGKAFLTDPQAGAIKWTGIQRKFSYLAKNEGRTLKIKYEDVITQPDKKIRQILNFLEVPYGGKGKIQVARRLNQLHSNINEKPLMERIHSWKSELNASEILKFEAFSYPMLENEGYELINSKLKLKLYRLCFKLLNRSAKRKK